MPLSALIDDLEYIAPLRGDEEWKLLKNSISTGHKKIVMKCCYSPGWMRISKLGTKHFYHAVATDCTWEKESAEHLYAKAEILLACSQAGYEAKAEVSGLDWRADVLATKDKIKIAFEVQWSNQTLEQTHERQSKFIRDGIRGCWFFRKPPFTKPSHDLPMFRIVLNESNNCFEVIINRASNQKKIELKCFIQHLLGGEIRYCEGWKMAAQQEVCVLFTPIECWKCQKNFNIYHIVNPYKTECGIEMEESIVAAYSRRQILDKFEPEIMKAVKDFLANPEGKSLQLGQIKKRYSHTRTESYLSFGCPSCDAIVGDFYISENLSNYQSRLDPNPAQFNVKLTVPNPVVIIPQDEDDNFQDYLAHWCYSEKGDFCSPKIKIKTKKPQSAPGKGLVTIQTVPYKQVIKSLFSHIIGE